MIELKAWHLEGLVFVKLFACVAHMPDAQICVSDLVSFIGFSFPALEVFLLFTWLWSVFHIPGISDQNKDNWPHHDMCFFKWDPVLGC